MSLIIIAISFSLAYYLFFIRKRKNVSFDIKCGARCYLCKEKIEVQDDAYWMTEKLDACKSCNRDLKLDILVNKHKFYKNKFKKYLIESNQLINSLLILTLTFIIIEIGVFIIFKTTFYNLSGWILIFYWIINTYKIRITSIKNPLRGGFD